jgi:hypothetical protein
MSEYNHEEYQLYPEGARIRPAFPEDFQEARREAFARANFECEVKREDCWVQAPIAHQIESRYGYDAYYDPEVTQTSDNILICCMNCHNWIHANPEEAISLGFLSDN